MQEERRSQAEFQEVPALLLTFLLLFLLLLLCFHTFGFLEVGDVFAPSFPLVLGVGEFLITGYPLVGISD